MMTMERLGETLASVRERMAPEIRRAAEAWSSEQSSGMVPSEGPACSVCRDAGFVRLDRPVDHPEFGTIAPCPVCGEHRRQAHLAKLAERLSGECGLEERQRAMSFESFERYVGNEKAFEAARRFADRGIERGQWLLIQGHTTGTGKTHLLAAIANDAIARGIPTFYSYTTELLDHLRKGYRARPDSEEAEAGDFDDRFERVKRIRLLLLDDFGVQVNTPWAEERVLALLDARLRAGLPTAITSNLKVADFARLPDRIVDRISRYEPREIVEMLAIKYRLYKKQHPSGAGRQEEVPW